MAQTAVLLAQAEAEFKKEYQETVEQSSELHDEAHGGAFPPFEASSFASQILWLAITFGALYFLMSRVALPRVASILEMRSDRIASDLAEAQRLKTDTEEAIASYETSLAEARTRAHQIAAETRDKVQKQADEQRKAVESDLAVRLSAAEKQIAETKAKALSNVRAIAVDAASAIVVQLLGKAPEAKDVETAVDASLKN